MFNLIIKDILIQKKTVVFFFLYTIFSTIFLRDGKGIGFVSTIVMVNYIIAITGFAYEEKNKCDIMLNSLPIKRSNIVLAKYFSILLYFIIGVASYFCTAFTIQLIGVPLKVFNITLGDVIGALFAVTLLSCINFPVMFKFGYTKSRAFIIGLMFAVFFGAPVLIKFLTKNGEDMSINSMINFFTNKSDMEISLYILGVILVMFLGSFLLSARLYESREF